MVSPLLCQDTTTFGVEARPDMALLCKSGYPWMARGLSVTPVYGDTLTYVGEYISGNPCTTLDCQSNSELQSGGQTRHGITGQECTFVLG